MPDPKPRLAIIGCGAVVEHHLFPALRRAGWLPSVLVDTSADRAARLRRAMPRRGRDVVVAEDWSSVADRFDAAIVAVPHVFHGPIGRALLAAGKHVFMEKPLATTSRDAVAMVRAAEDRHLVLSVGLLRRYLDVARWTKALVASGTLGEIKRFEAREGFVFNWATSSNAFLKRELAGGGVLMDTGAHTLDLLHWWLGGLKVMAFADDATTDEAVEADCVMECTTESGGLGRLELSRSLELSNSVRIEGTAGFVEVHLYKNEVLDGSANALAFASDGVMPATLAPQLFTALFDAEIADFLTSTTRGARARRGVDGREGLAALALIEDCYAIRRPLHLPWTNPGRTADGTGPTLPPGCTVVITGATGFIGGQLAERLSAAGAKVRCPVRTLGQASRLARLPVDIVRLDLADAEAVSTAIAGADYVFHCAYDPKSRAQNLVGTANISEACIAHGVKRLVHVSSFSVYEPLPDGPLNEATRDGNRDWTYIDVKLRLEAGVLDACANRGLSGCVVQPTIVYGPFCKYWTNNPAEMLIHGDVVLPEHDGLCCAVYVDDLLDGMVLAATEPRAQGQRFILSGPDGVSWARFFGEIAQALKVPGPHFWSKARVSQASGGLVRDIRMVLSDPKRIVQVLVRWPPGRRVLQAGLEALPKTLRGLVDVYYFGSGGPKFGQVFVPDPRTLALYSAKPAIDLAKARELLGYEPRHSFDQGMVPTAAYLEWAYGDVASRRARNGSTPTGPKAASETGTGQPNDHRAGAHALSQFPEGVRAPT